MKRYFITCVLPENLIRKYKESIAACNFSFNLMSGGGFDEVFSMLSRHVTGKLEPIDDNRFTLVYSKIRHLGRHFSWIAILSEQIQIFRRVERRSSVWFYNIHSLNSIVFLLLKAFKPSVQLNILMLDYTPV